MILAMHKELIVSLSDIHLVTVSCDHCKTTVCIDLANPSEFSKKHDGVILTNECPGCRSRYDSSTIDALEKLQKVFDNIKTIRGLTFRVGDVNA